MYFGGAYTIRCYGVGAEAVSAVQIEAEPRARLTSQGQRDYATVRSTAVLCVCSSPGLFLTFLTVSDVSDGRLWPQALTSAVLAWLKVHYGWGKPSNEQSTPQLDSQGWP